MASTASAAHFPPLPSAAAAAAAANTSIVSDSDSSGSSDRDEAVSQAETLESSIFSTYLHVSGGSGIAPDLFKIRSFIASTRRGSFSSCLICLERIRSSDPVWSCSSGCHASFHLFCIQSWAQQCFSLRPSSISPSSSSTSSNWHCPKCRLTYAKELVPRAYFCYCGKVENPPFDPWILPHSCGDICGRPLQRLCGHECLLLCHPGPCPPCPKLVSSLCFCGSTEDVRRCALKAFSCNKRCSKLSSCKAHRCPEKCHDGPCPPCRVRAMHKCQCGGTEEEKECSESEFRCNMSCSGMLGCGKHPCGQGCHSGDCGDCPLQGKRTCPCGKKFYHGVACDTNVPTCGLTCDKILNCKLHRCPERCHRGQCVETCRIMTMKTCKCGSLKKQVPCHQDLSCERKCQRPRDCGRHACKRRCCDGDCPPCPEICGRKLRCNNHKCPSPCHRGACAPCPLMVTISCFCGETHFEVPCGVEKDKKPPKCPKACQVPRLCRHSSVCRKHKCHYGGCPPCQMICDEQLPCGHTCKQRCHGPVPAANPDFTLRPKKKKMEKPSENKPGTPCSPCQEIVMRSCLGHHIGEEQAMVCSDRRRFSCPNLCGNLLQCGNHYCTKPCHALMQQSAAFIKDERHQNLRCYTKNKDLAELCEDCLLPCQKERKPRCQHPCPLPCHIGDCEPCKVLIKRSCHCGSMVHVFECTYYNNLTYDEQQKARSCKGPCHRKLPNCSHLCSELCHPGECPSSDNCRKKVTVRCACHNLKKEWQCQEVQNAYCNSGRDPKEILRNHYGIGVLACNSECMNKVKVDDSEILLRKPNIVKDKAQVDKEFVPKRRKRRERVVGTRQISKFEAIKRISRMCVYIVVTLVVVLVSMHYGYKGIFWLSDRMNEIERRQLRGGYRRF